jgi:hypothetical protein
MFAPRRFIGALLILASLALPACDETSFISIYMTATPSPCDGDFHRMVPQGWTLDDKKLLDTDDDGESECVVFYRADTTVNPKKIAPVYGVVYHHDRGEPTKWVYPYPLQLPNGYYLGEHQVSARMESVLSGLNRRVLIVEDKDFEDNIVEASLFVWHGDNGQSINPPDPKEQYYELLGWFMSEGGVQIGQDIITVTERIVGTRSRLANLKIYRPNQEAKPYYQPKTSKLVEPETELISLVECNDPDAVCYPERMVLKFYQNLHDDSGLEGLMTPDAYSKLMQDKQFKYGCGSNRADVDRVLVQDLKIQGNDNKPQIVVTGKCKSKEGKLTNMIPVTWTLERNNQGKWLLKSSK